MKVICTRCLYGRCPFEINRPEINWDGHHSGTCAIPKVEVDYISHSEAQKLVTCPPPVYKQSVAKGSSNLRVVRIHKQTRVVKLGPNRNVRNQRISNAQGYSGE